MLIAWVVRKKHLFNAIEFSRSLGDTAASRAGHEHMNRRPDCKSRGEAFAGCIIQNMVVVLGEQQRRHHSTPASFFSFPTRSSTEVTLIPACLLEGSTVLIILRRSFVSTPSASGVVSWIGFFLAFMMLGSEAYRGSLRRRSVVTTAGIFRTSVWRPPSISRVTVRLSPSTPT